jgi:SAM-dependent methyltransferase
LERWLLDAVDVRPGETVLELASGFGALGLRLAGCVRPGGQTICSDLRAERVDATRRRAEEAGATDVDVRVLDMLRLELPDASVDGVVCRWGFMFPLPSEQAFAEAQRVLRPGRSLALAAWADPDRNPWISLVDDALRGEGHPTPDDRRSPGRMFSLSDPGRLRALMTGAGFGGVVVDEVRLAWAYDGFEAYWGEEALVAGPYEDYLRALPASESLAIQRRLRSSMEPWALPAGGYLIPGVTLVAKGRRDPG